MQEFTHFIAESKRHAFKVVFKETKFFSVIMDGSTVAGDLEDQFVMVEFCIIDKKLEELNLILTSCQ